MSTVELRDKANSTIQVMMRSPFAVLFIIGLMLWYASLMTVDQRAALRDLMTVLNNPIGFGILALILASLLYAMIYPVFAFLANLLTSYIASQQTIYGAMREHFEASKQMCAQLIEIKTLLKFSSQLAEIQAEIEHPKAPL